MMLKRQRKVRRGMTRALRSTLLVPAALLAIVIVISAQTVILPPLVTETIVPQPVNPGDKVRITITVSNPNPPGRVDRIDDSSWYNLRLTTNVDLALQIDDVGVVPPPQSLSVNGSTVIVTANSLDPGESFTTTIDCTVLGDVLPGHLVNNETTLEYTDTDGNPQPPIKIISVLRVMLPIVFR